MILVFWMLTFKPTFSLSSFNIIKRLFNSSLLSAIRVVSSAYLRLLIFLPEILIPACALSSPAFHMMYSAYKLNKQGDNIQPWCTPFPIFKLLLIAEGRECRNKRGVIKETIMSPWGREWSDGEWFYPGTDFFLALLFFFFYFIVTYLNWVLIRWLTVYCHPAYLTYMQST